MRWGGRRSGASFHPGDLCRAAGAGERRRREGDFERLSRTTARNNRGRPGEGPGRSPQTCIPEFCRPGGTWAR